MTMRGWLWLSSKSEPGAPVSWRLVTKAPLWDSRVGSPCPADGGPEGPAPGIPLFWVTDGVVKRVAKRGFLNREFSVHKTIDDPIHHESEPQIRLATCGAHTSQIWAFIQNCTCHGPGACLAPKFSHGGGGGEKGPAVPQPDHDMPFMPMAPNLAEICAWRGRFAGRNFDENLCHRHRAPLRIWPWPNLAMER